VTHFRDEAERLRAREAVERVTRHNVAAQRLALQVFDRDYPPQPDAPPVLPCKKCGGLAACWCDMPKLDTPTPPDFDAAVEELLAWFDEPEVHIDRDEWCRLSAAARQRVRELYEAHAAKMKAYCDGMGQECDRLVGIIAALRAAQGEGWEATMKMGYNGHEPAFFYPSFDRIVPLRTGDRVRVVKVAE
jgi:hypothetical protein